MPIFDFPLEQLRTYKPPRQEPADFDRFWQAELAAIIRHDPQPEFVRVDYGLATVETFDVTFKGYGGQPVKAWFLVPRGRKGRLPCVVEFIGYGGGRGFPHEWLLWSSAGYAHLVVDTRGQGSVWSTGDTPDIPLEGSSPHTPGFMTLGVLDPRTYYYRRVFLDGVQAIRSVRAHPEVDPEHIAVTGGSQGGGITLAMAGLLPEVAVAMPDVPFLCHYRRATELVDTQPYMEIVTYCKAHRDQVETVFHTLSYFDGVNFAARSQARALFSVALMDDICPPSTVFAAYNHYAGLKEIRVWPYNGHEGGGPYQEVEKVKFLRSIFNPE